jgi:hypothetical protein
MPVATVQTVMSELSDLVSHNMVATMETVHDVVIKGGGTEALAEQVSKAVQGHPLCSTLDPQSGPMRSQVARMSYFKKAFRFIEPVAIQLIDPGNRVKVYHYIPIASTLKSLFQDPRIKHYFRSEISTNRELRDFTDGSAYKNDPFIQSTPDCVSLLLYQDEFELVNPIGITRLEICMQAVTAKLMVSS